MVVEPNLLNGMYIFPLPTFSQRFWFYVSETLNNNRPPQEANVNDHSVKELFLGKGKGFLEVLGYYCRSVHTSALREFSSMVFPLRASSHLPSAGRKSMELGCEDARERKKRGEHSSENWLSTLNTVLAGTKARKKTLSKTPLPLSSYFLLQTSY